MKNEKQKPEFFFIVPQALMQQFVIAIGKMNFNLNDAETMLHFKHRLLGCEQVKQDPMPDLSVLSPKMEKQPRPKPIPEPQEVELNDGTKKKV